MWSCYILTIFTSSIATRQIPIPSLRSWTWIFPVMPPLICFAMARFILWRVREKDQSLDLVDANGQRFPFKLSTTWFQVVTDETQLLTDGSAWRFELILLHPE